MKNKFKQQLTMQVFVMKSKKVKKNAERNGKNYCLNGFLRGQFLDSKAKLEELPLIFRKFFENFYVIAPNICRFREKLLIL